MSFDVGRQSSPAGGEVTEPDDVTGKADKETLAIPEGVRRRVDERDDYRCRVCGKWLGRGRALHHIRYGGDERGTGGRRVHDPDDIITICWMYAPDCHSLVHSSKAYWQPLLLEVVQRPGLTARQLARWRDRRG